MFNLIVSGSGWQTHRDSFGSGRVLEYTDTAVAQRWRCVQRAPDPPVAGETPARMPVGICSSRTPLV